MSAVRLAIVVGVLLRLAFGLGYWTGKPLTHDEREYLGLAANLARGHGFVSELEGEPAPAQRFGRAPGYPFVLAPLALLDADLRAGRMPADVPTAIKIAQAFLGGAVVALLAGLVRRVAGSRAGVTAAWLAALFPPLVWMPAYALSEQVYAVLAIGCAAALGALTDPPSPRLRGASPQSPGLRGATEPDRRAAPPLLIVAGLLAGVAALTRPAMLLFLPFAAVLLLRRAPEVRVGLVRAMLFGAATLAVIAPWTARNLAVYGRVVLIASEGGVTFWTGNHREAIGEGDLAANPHLKVRNLEFRAAHPGLSEEALEPLYYRAALDHIAADPLWWLGLEAKKLWYTFVPFGPSYRLHARSYFWTSAVSVLLILPAAAAGLWRAPRGARPAALLALAASSVVVGLVFFPQERFRLPVLDPALLACAALLAARPAETVR
jgi:4-amino-4-deoxy-L-arabinose transferase-like glycosyltransferase